MTTLTVAAHNNGTAATLTLTPSVSVTAITRTDSNGTVAIRVPAGTFPRSSPVALTDWEPALGSTVTYSVPGAVAAITLGSALPWLVAPLRPDMSQPVEMITDYAAGRISLGTIHQVVDRIDPLVALGRLAARSGSLTAWVPSYAAGRSLEDMIDRAGVLMLKQAQHAGQDMYFITTSCELVSDPEDGWTLTLAYQEITRPLSPINTAVWTFASVSHSFASFANVSSKYADFEMLSINDQNGVI